MVLGKLQVLTLLLASLLIFAGCAPAEDAIESMEIEVIDDVSYASADDVAAALTMDMIPVLDTGDILLTQGNHAYQLKSDSPFVYADGIRIGYFKDAVLQGEDQLLIPLSFLTDYLNLEIVTGNQESWDLVADTPAFNIIEHIKFSAEEVIQALDNELTPSEAPLLDQVLVPTSLGVDTPNIRMELVIDASPINSTFRDILEYNYYLTCDQLLSELTNEDYHTITASRLMEEREIEAAVRLYPDLAEAPLATWTYGEYIAYDQSKTAEDFRATLTEAQLVAIETRGIQESDLFQLRKWFHTIDNILLQEDEVLIEALTEIYSFKLDVVRQLAEHSADR